MRTEDGFFCDVCFYECSERELTPTRSLVGNWEILRCPQCVQLNAEPLHEIENRVAWGLPPNWLYYLTTYLQDPISKGGRYLVYSEIAG